MSLCDTTGDLFVKSPKELHFNVFEGKRGLMDQTVVWCSLSDDCQTIARCLLDVSPDACQLPPDICQTSTTY